MALGGGPVEGAPPPGGEDPRDEEVRVALALNGGVSLAVWMGGCAVELDCARRAHLGPEQKADDQGTRSIYHGLCKALGRVLVVDIMSGASAGGINGGLLAAAIRHARWLPSDYIRKKWLELGDASKLLQRISEPAPTALMQGGKFYEDLRSTFEEIVEGNAGKGAASAEAGGPICGESDPVGSPTRLPDGQGSLSELDVKLIVTTTNLTGEPRTFRDFWGQELTAREYRGRFRFGTRADYTPETLAVAGRSSASFPLAFEPWHVRGAAGELADFSQARWVVDGGLLDNAPIADALALIPTRPAQRQVQRFLCYVNAEPVEQPVLAPLGREVEPSLEDVLGGVVGLPRKAPFVDQLDAIERATRNSRFGEELPELSLLSADLGSVRATADALLDSYRRRRLLLSVEEIVEQAADAQALVEDMSGRPDPPWLPVDLEPRREGRWQWGLSAAYRTIQLVIDLLARAIGDAPAANRLQLLMARQDMDASLLAVEGMMAGLLKAPPGDLPADVAMKRAADEMEMIDPIPALRAVASAACGVAELLDRDERPTELASALFGPDWRSAMSSVREREVLPPASFDHFLKRMLATEVLRRSLETDDHVRPTQQLRFAQLTPYAPSLIFTAKPVCCEGWATPQEKLLGLGLGHFAGFYRRSWRANDFMWGRLDAAARVVDLLVSADRAVRLASDGARPAWETMARTLLDAEPQPVQTWLLEEVLGAAPDDCETTVTQTDDWTPLGRKLVKALKADLTEGASKTRGTLTRILFSRAAQAEILGEELKHLEEESSEDEARGAGSKALNLSDDLKTAIEELRAGPTLPRRLTGEDEIVSDLAVQTGTHAGLVGLAMMRTAGVPFKRALFLLRAPLLQAGGTVARSPLYRAAVLAAYWSLAVFLASRLLTISRHRSPTLGLLRSTAEAMTLVALVGILGMTVVPGLRAWRVKARKRRLGEGAWAVGLLAAGALAAVLLTRFVGKLSWERLLTAPGADSPPSTVLAICLALALGAPLGGILATGRSAADTLLSSRFGGAFASILVIVVAGVLVGFTVNPVASAFNEAAWWRVVIAALAIGGAPGLAIGYLFRRR